LRYDLLQSTSSQYSNNWVGSVVTCWIFILFWIFFLLHLDLKLRGFQVTNKRPACLVDMQLICSWSLCLRVVGNPWLRHSSHLKRCAQQARGGCTGHDGQHAKDLHGRLRPPIGLYICTMGRHTVSLPSNYWARPQVTPRLAPRRGCPGRNPRMSVTNTETDTTFALIYRIVWHS
jgi:hypothetical protein